MNRKNNWYEKILKSLSKLWQSILKTDNAQKPDTNIVFVVSDNFKTDTSETATVKISGANHLFKKYFFGLCEKTKNTPIQYGYLDHQKDHFNPKKIIANLGGESKVITTMFGIYQLMKHQKSGQRQAILHKGHPNIFCVRDTSGIPRTVITTWFNEGWNLNTLSIDDTYKWGGRFRIFYPRF